MVETQTKVGERANILLVKPIHFLKAFNLIDPLYFLPSYMNNSTTVEGRKKGNNGAINTFRRLRWEYSHVLEKSRGNKNEKYINTIYLIRFITLTIYILIHTQTKQPTPCGRRPQSLSTS